MPTLLGLCGIAIPRTVEGQDFSSHLRGKKTDDDAGALLACYAPFGEWTREQGGREYRGVRTARFTYVRDLHGPWLMYDNERDPYQLENLCGRSEYAERQARLDALLARKLKETHDVFLPGDAYVRQWGYTTDKTGTVPYQP
jgi:arylsulfatase A-like enzyme